VIDEPVLRSPVRRRSIQERSDPAPFGSSCEAVSGTAAAALVCVASGFFRKFSMEEVEAPV
jgi:hypothetical protein